MPHSTVTIELTPEEREALASIMRAGRGCGIFTSVADLKRKS